MFSDVLYFLLNVLFSLFGIALIIRAWMYAIRLHPFNPYSQAVLRATNWFVTPLRNVIKPGNRVDWPSLFACWLTALLYLLMMWLLLTGRLPSSEGLVRSLVAAVVTMAKWAFNVVLWVTLIQAILSWVNPMAPVMPLLHTLTAPLLDPIRRFMPNLGGLDLSPLALLLLAQVAIMVLQRFAFNIFGV